MGYRDVIEMLGDNLLDYGQIDISMGHEELTYKYKFSIVMAVYNTELYLREAVESIVNQDIGFSEHVQLILVDDGSTDGSGELCDIFASLWPKNIKVIHKENGGVSSARNAGIPYVEGEFVNFMDADDKISQDALRKVYDFFSIHKDEVDLVEIPSRFFGSREGNAWNYYSFKSGTRVIDLSKEPDVVTVSMSSSYVAREAISELRFDARLRYSEDQKVCVEVLLNKCKKGVVSDATYWYRRREGESAIDTCQTKRTWYIDCLKYYLIECLNLAKEKWGSIPMFVQRTALRELTWKMQAEAENFLEAMGANDTDELQGILSTIMHHISDEAILQSNGNWGYWQEHMTYLLRKKYNEPSVVSPDGDNLVVAVHDTEIIRLSNCKACLTSLVMKEDSVTLEGYATFLGVQDYSDVHVYLLVNKTEKIECTIERSIEFSKVCLGENIFPAFNFRGVIEQCSGQASFEVGIGTGVGPNIVKNFNLRVDEGFPIQRALKNAYCADNGWMAYLNGHSLVIRRAGESEIAAREESFLAEISGKKGKAAKEAVLYRRLYHQLKPHVKNPLWVFVPGVDNTGNNKEWWRSCWDFLEKRGAWRYVEPYVAQGDGLKETQGITYPGHVYSLFYLLAEKIFFPKEEPWFWGTKAYFADILGKQEHIEVDCADEESNLALLQEEWERHPLRGDSVSFHLEEAQIYVEHIFRTLNPVTYPPVEKIVVKTIKQEYMKYIFPCHLIKEGERIVIYGAGEVGREFCRQLQKYRFANVVALVDRNASSIEGCEFPVRQVSDLSSLEYDSILIAIRFEEIAKSARDALLSMGIPKEKIKWDGTMYHVDDFYRNFYMNLARDRM